MKKTTSLAAAALLLASALPAAPVYASPAQDAYLAHLAECLELLATDPIEQARVCGDGEPGASRSMDLTPPAPPAAPSKPECPDIEIPLGRIMPLVEIDCPLPA